MKKRMLTAFVAVAWTALLTIPAIQRLIKSRFDPMARGVSRHDRYCGSSEAAR